MTVEFCGMIGTRSASELDGAAANLIGGHVDRDFVRDFAQAHEKAGFDRVLVGYGSAGADSFSVAAYAAAHTERLNFLIAHRPGFVAPTLAARKLATLDQFTQGRIAVHIITGGHDAEMQRDGDWLGKDDRYRRTDEYLDVMKLEWTSGGPFDYEGEYYHVKGASTEVKCFQQPHVPVYFGGMSGPALAVGAKHADVYAVWGEPVASVQATMGEVNASAAEHGRKPRYSVSFRPIIASNEEAAWEKARGYLERIVSARGGVIPKYNPPNSGSQRLLALAEDGDVHDERLWTAIAKAVGASGNTTALVGTPEQVCESMLRYYDAGVSTILIRGFEPLPDAIDYGKELIPMVRAEVAKRDRAAVGAR
jgi:alkanesulfonate monooxygenase